MREAASTGEQPRKGRFHTSAGFAELGNIFAHRSEVKKMHISPQRIFLPVDKYSAREETSSREEANGKFDSFSIKRRSYQAVLCVSISFKE